MTLTTATDQGRNFIAFLAALPLTAAIVAGSYGAVNFLV